MDDEPTTDITLRERPSQDLRRENFEIVKGSLSALAEDLREGQVLVRTDALSLDPYVRARITDRASYRPPIALGEVIPGEVVGTVLASSDARHRAGDRVLAHAGWRSHAILDAEGVRPVPKTLSSTHALGVLGMPGLTAYAGLTEYGRLRNGETLVVAAATGPVGSLVGQIALRHGLRVVGIVGGADKCDVVTGQLGFDAAVDRNDPDFAAALAAACPDGIDIDFVTAGGSVFEAVLPLLNRRARVIVCGLVGQWAAPAVVGPSARDLLRTTLDRSLSIHGFVVGDLAAQHRERFLAEYAPLVDSGEVVALEHRTSGIHRAPEAFIAMLAGAHIGKTLVVNG